jgi:hypothetical protein
MSRLLHAAARGARIEDNALGRWTETEFLDLKGCVFNYRIHPKDKHLQYGPISTALREAAAGNAWDATGVFGLMARCYLNWNFWQWTSDSDRSLFYLILAEALADEGL